MVGHGFMVYQYRPKPYSLARRNPCIRPSPATRCDAAEFNPGPYRKPLPLTPPGCASERGSNADRRRARSRKDTRRSTEVGVAVNVLNRMLELGRPISVRIPQILNGVGAATFHPSIRVTPPRRGYVARAAPGPSPGECSTMRAAKPHSRRYSIASSASSRRTSRTRAPLVTLR